MPSGILARREQAFSHYKRACELAVKGYLELDWGPLALASQQLALGGEHKEVFNDFLWECACEATDCVAINMRAYTDYLQNGVV